MPDPHERSIASALKSVEALGKISDQMRAGNSPIYRAYRTVLRALRGNTSNVAAVQDAMKTLQDSIHTAAIDYYDRAVGVGMAQAERDLAIYDLGRPDDPNPSNVGMATTATLGLVENQARQAVASAQLDLGEETVIGDDNRRGVVQPAPIIGAIAFWTTTLSVVSYEQATSRKMPEVVRQAVAQIDAVTTETCLNVHGQIVGEAEDFNLTGEPRYADEMHDPPFHRGCRTAVAKILPDLVDPEVTQEMRENAIEQGKKAKPSAIEGRAHYRVVGKSVQKFRGGRWHTLSRTRTVREARVQAERLNRK